MRKFVMTKKTIIASASAAAMIVIGAVSVAAVAGIQRTSVSSEDSSTISTTDITCDTTTTSPEMPTEVSESTIKASENTKLEETSASTSLIPTTGTISETTKKTEAVTLAGVKEVSLNITSQSDTGTLQFSKAKIDYDFNQVYFYFSILANEKTDIKGQSINLNTGSKLLRIYNGSLPTPTKQEGGTYKADNCYVSFAYIPDGSPVTFNYAFTGHETQSVTINIPGV